MKPRVLTRFMGGTACLLLIALVAAPNGFLWCAESGSGTGGKGSLESLFTDLQRLLRDLEKNRAEQARMWPNREEAQRREMPPPPSILQLDAIREKLDREVRGIQEKLERAAPESLGNILSELEKTRDPAYVEVLVPVVAAIGKGDPRTAGVLLGLARRLQPCPLCVHAVLGALDREDASFFLLEEGLKQKRLALLEHSMASGRPDVLERIIASADGGDSQKARLSRDAILRLTPPLRMASPGQETFSASSLAKLGSREEQLDEIVRRMSSETGTREWELRNLVVSRIGTVRSDELRAALIVYLGLFRNTSDLSFLQSIYRGYHATNVRLACLGALGNLGPVSGEFLLEELEQPEIPLEIRRGCVLALGSCRHEPSARAIVQLLTDPDLKGEAVRALQRIVGRDLGRSPEDWLRWWRSRPEYLEGRNDPDDR